MVGFSKKICTVTITWMNQEEMGNPIWLRSIWETEPLELALKGLKSRHRNRVDKFEWKCWRQDTKVNWF